MIHFVGEHGFGEQIDRTQQSADTDGEQCAIREREAERARAQRAAEMGALWRYGHHLK